MNLLNHSVVFINVFDSKSREADLLLDHDGGVVVQCVTQHVATHALA